MRGCNSPPGAQIASYQPGHTSGAQKCHNFTARKETPHRPVFMRHWHSPSFERASIQSHHTAGAGRDTRLSGQVGTPRDAKRTMCPLFRVSSRDTVVETVRTSQNTTEDPSSVHHPKGVD